MYSIQAQLKLSFFLLFYLINAVVGGVHQRRLLKHLLIDSQYDPLERPVQNDSQTLPVTMNLALQQIIDFNGKNQFIILSGWIVLTWHDYSLTWKPEEYGNIETIRIPTTQIWTPDVLLYNSGDEKFDSTMKVNAVVQYTGNVLYVPPGIFKSICPFNIASFPFDTQSCTLKFGSWTQDEAGINLTAESNRGQLDAYINNTEWDLEDFSAVNSALKYDCCPTLYPFVLFTIRIRRRSLYYVTNVVVPCFLISCMTILGFLLAPDSGEKLTLQITILLSVVTFSLLISDIMPPSSTAIPVITMYFLCVMIMSTISVTASVLVISLHFRNAKNHTMPFWIHKYICHYLAWFLCMKHPGYNLTWHAIRHQYSSTYPRSDSVSKHMDIHYPRCHTTSISSDVTNINKQSFLFAASSERRQSDSVSKTNITPVSTSQNINDDQHSSTVSHICDSNIIHSELRTIISQLAIVTNHIQRHERHDNASQVWKFVAMVIDRLFLIIFTMIMTIFTILTFVSKLSFYTLR